MPRPENPLFPPGNAAAGPSPGDRERFYRIQAWILAAVLALAPLYPQHIVPEYAFLFRSSVALFLFAAAWTAGWFGLARHWLKNPLAWPLTLVLTLAAVAMFYSPDFYRAKEKLAVYAAATGLLAALSARPRDPAALRLWLSALALGGALAAGHALYLQWTGHAETLQTLETTAVYDEAMQQNLIETLRANRAMGAFGNPNHLAGYLVMTLWAMWLLHRRLAARSLRIAIIFAGAFVCFSVYQTYSRSGLAALAFTLAAFAMYPWLRGGCRVRPAWLLAGAAGLLVLTAGAWAFKDQLLGGRLLVGSTLMARLHFFRGAVAIVQDFPWLGAGTEGFEAFYSQYLRPGDLEARYAHNWLLECAAEWGPMGVAAFFFATFALLKWAVRDWRRNTLRRPFVYAAAGSAATLLLVSMVDFHNNLPEMLTVPALLLGWALPPRGEPRAETQPFKWGFGLNFAALAFWFLLAAAPFVNQTCRENGYYCLIDNQYPQARAWCEWALMADPSDAESWNRLGHVWKINPTPQARAFMIKCFRSAVRWAPRRASMRADYADALFSLGYAEEAIREMQRAKALFPARPVYCERLAAMYEALGRTDEAEAERAAARALQAEIDERSL